jgi:hypothetical protein
VGVVSGSGGNKIDGHHFALHTVVVVWCGLGLGICRASVLHLQSVFTRGECPRCGCCGVDDEEVRLPEQSSPDKVSSLLLVFDGSNKPTSSTPHSINEEVCCVFLCVCCRSPS